MNSDNLADKVNELEVLLKSGSGYEDIRQSAMKLLEQINLNQDMELHCRVLLIITESFCRRGLAQDALPYSNQAMQIALQLQLKPLLAKTLGNHGTVFWHLGDYASAISNYQQALQLNKELDNAGGAASNLGNIANVYWHLSDFSRALDNLQEALSLNEQTANIRGVAANLGNIGGIYVHLANHNLGLEYMLKALAAYTEIDHTDGVAIWTGNIGTVYAELGEHRHALEWYQKALLLHEKSDNQSGIETNLVNIASEYSELKDYSQAMQYYQKAYSLNLKLGHKRNTAMDLANIGGLYAQSDFKDFDPILAEEYLRKSIDQLREMGARKELYEVHRSIAGLYERLERWKEHSHHFVKYHEIEKEVQNEEVHEQAQQLEYRRKIEDAERDRQVKLARFQEQEKILHNILPSQIADRILEGEKQIADYCENVSIFFSDIVGFTKLSQKQSPQELVSMLNEVFSEFDRLARRHGLEKIKTIGDAYMAVAGVPLAQEDHAARAAAFAIDAIEFMKEYRKTSHSDLQIRIGLHCGRAIAGVIGENKFAYDLWGDSVNTASRMESHGEAGKIHVSEDFRNALLESEFHFKERGEMEIKGKGKMKTYFLEKKN